ncbi:MAG: DUF5317 domain-containing protein [Chloroflexota bacterium]
MVLWLALGAGLVTGIGVSRWQGHPYRPPALQYVWLVFAGFLPQFLAIYLANTRVLFPDWLAASCILISQVALLVFSWFNRRLPGMPVLIVGLMFNLAVIAANGGFMPINPQTAERLVGVERVASLEDGSRFGFKDILLQKSETELEWLADRFLPPQWLPYQVAFSLGDVLVGLGVFQVLANQKLNG